jgi:hypothetical protein
VGLFQVVDSIRWSFSQQRSVRGRMLKIVHHTVCDITKIKETVGQKKILDFGCCFCVALFSCI